MNGFPSWAGDQCYAWTTPNPEAGYRVAAALRRVRDPNFLQAVDSMRGVVGPVLLDPRIPVQTDRPEGWVGSWVIEDTGLVVHCIKRRW